MKAAPELIALLYANLGKPLTADMCADICMASDRRHVTQPLPEPFEHGHVIYDGSAEVGPIVFQVERMVDVVPEIRVLHADHWEETEKYRAGIPFNPDYAQYVAIDRAGSFLLVTARAKDAMIGYFMIVLHTSRHSSQRVAAEDAFYLKPECRLGFALITMLRFTEACAVRAGAKQLTLSEKLTHLIGPCLKRTGFTHCGNLWTKVLK